jgi:hypothetical protein
MAQQLQVLVQTPDIFLDKLKVHLLRTTELINQFWFSRIFQLYQGCKNNSTVTVNRQVIDKMCDLILNNWIPKTKDMANMSMEMQLSEDSITVTISLSNAFTYGHGGNTCMVSIPLVQLNHITSTYVLLLSKHYDETIIAHNKTQQMTKTAILTSTTNTASTIKLSQHKLFSIDPFFDNRHFGGKPANTPEYRMRQRRRGNLESLYCNDTSIKLRKVSLNVGDKMVLLLHGVAYMGQFVETYADIQSIERVLISIFSAYEHLMDGKLKTSLIAVINSLSSLQKNQVAYTFIYNYIDEHDIMDIDYSTSKNESTTPADIARVTRTLVQGLCGCCVIEKCKTCKLIEYVTQ